MATVSKYYDMVFVFVTESSGHGPFTLGAAVTGYQTAAAAGITNGTPVSYRATDGVNWETAHGVVDVSGSVYTLTRGVDTLKSSNSNALVNFGSGVTVVIAPLSQDLSSFVSALGAQTFTTTQIGQVQSNIGIANGILGVPFLFAANTSGNPGSGNWAANNATLSSATTIQFNFTNAFGVNIGNYFSNFPRDLCMSIYDSTSGALFVCLVTAKAASASWETLTVVPQAVSGTFTAGDLCYVQFSFAVGYGQYPLDSTAATSDILTQTSTGVQSYNAIPAVITAAVVALSNDSAPPTTAEAVINESGTLKTTTIAQAVTAVVAGLSNDSAPPTSADIVINESGTLKTTTIAQASIAARKSGSIGGTNGNSVTPASNTYEMFGSGGYYTPVLSGTLLVFGEWDGYQMGAGADDYLVRYGTGTAPVNGAALAGTSIGPVIGLTSTGLHITHVGIVSGLTVGTQYWFDYAGSNNNGTSSIYVFNPSFSLLEI